VIAGLALSFSVVTLVGSALLALLHLPQDAIRWVALAALVAIGVGLIFPKVEALLEKPFSRLPQKQFGSGSSGFGLGLALGVLYVPCAGPVLAAIVIAGATGTIGLPTVALTLSFAVGAALPLLFFALAGRRVAERVASFRSRQREIRIAAGIVTILLAVALVFNLPAALQRAIPDYTGKLQETVGGDEQLREKLNLGGLVNDQNKELANCTNGAPALEACGTAPDITGITGYPERRRGRSEVVARQGSSGRFLGLLMHQLPARDPPHRRLVCGLQRRRSGGDRGAHTGVRVRTRSGERRERRKRSRHHLSDRPGPQLLDVDQLPQQVLARQVPDRRERHRTAHQVRRGRLRADGKPYPPTALRRAPRCHVAEPDRGRRHHSPARPHAGDLSGSRQGSQLWRFLLL
jgi:cytochrome c biogenesis protein CcdA